MARPTIAELTDAAATATEPSLTRDLGIRPGGVDPLGLRQINFNLMDLVIPGLNNVARHIRPFTVMAWAWRRAALCARKSGATLEKKDLLLDFVARIEVIYVWSQLVYNPAVELPGRDYLAFLLQRQEFTFGGKEWEGMRSARQDSTALSAAVNYGPALKSLGWVEASEDRGVYRAGPVAIAAVDALDRALGVQANHEAFSRLGYVTVSKADVGLWGKLWALEKLADEERSAMHAAFFSSVASNRRREGASLIAEIVSHYKGKWSERQVRSDMCGGAVSFNVSPALQVMATYWRAMQARQLFRLALESLLYWAMLRLDQRRSVPWLAAAFVEGTDSASTVKVWVEEAVVHALTMSQCIENLENELSRQAKPQELASAIHLALASSLVEVAAGPDLEADDRLPMERARREMQACKHLTPHEWMAHVFRSWILGQHVYWSVGRGLGDARGNGKTILRLKIVPEEGGWILAPGARANPPSPTPDRLSTALSLMKEAGVFSGLPK